MKDTLFNGILAMLVLMFFVTIHSCNQSNASNKPLLKEDSLIFTKAKVQQIEDIKADFVKDSAAYGVCDTCAGSYQSVILEHRLLIQQVVESNAELSQILAQNKEEYNLQDSLLQASRKFRRKYEIRYGLLKERR